MKTVNSISGGKTSAFMAVHYPADINIFALVLTDHRPSAPKDKGLICEVVKRISNFVATHEDDQTLRAVLELEQFIQKEIKWVAADFALERFVVGNTDLPGYRSSSARLFDSQHRFCTIEQKIRPIAHHLQMFGDGDPVLMQIGFRFDEPQRVLNWNCKNDKIKIPVSCRIKNHRVSYTKEIEWRTTDFPLYRNRVDKQIVTDFWRNKIAFPEISNCRFCPFHTDIQLKRQSKIHSDNLEWWTNLEDFTGYTFGKRPLVDRLTQELIPGVYEEKSCHCTD